MSRVEDAIPGVAEAKEAFAIAKVVWPLLAAVGGAGAVGGAWLYVQHLQHAKQAAEAKAASEHASATVAQSQTQAQQAASSIVDQGRAKADVTVHIQQENARAILDAPGASAALDPALNAAGRRSLCNFELYNSDPGCAGLSGAGSGQPTGSGPAGPTPAG